MPPYRASQPVRAEGSQPHSRSTGGVTESDSQPLSDSVTESESGGVGGFGGIAARQSWRDGCWFLYIKPGGQGCKRVNCRFRHDLTLDEVLKFQQLQSDSHVVFLDSSSSNLSESRGSDSKGEHSKNTMKSEKFSNELSEKAAGDADYPLSGQMQRVMEEQDTDHASARRPPAASSSSTPAAPPDLFDLGSSEHERGVCKPCAFAALDSCAAGSFCRYCHLPHDGVRIKMRPCKGKRDRFKRLMDRIAEEIAADPLGHDVLSIKLPPSVAENDLLRRRVEDWVAQRLEEERRRVQPGAQPAPEVPTRQPPKRTFGVVSL